MGLLIFVAGAVGFEPTNSILEIDSLPISLRAREHLVFKQYEIAQKLLNLLFENCCNFNLRKTFHFIPHIYLINLGLSDTLPPSTLTFKVGSFLPLIGNTLAYFLKISKVGSCR